MPQFAPRPITRTTSAGPAVASQPLQRSGIDINPRGEVRHAPIVFVAPDRVITNDNELFVEA